MLLQVLDKVQLQEPGQVYKRVQVQEQVLAQMPEQVPEQEPVPAEQAQRVLHIRMSRRSCRYFRQYRN